MPTSRKDWGIEEYTQRFHDLRSELVELQENKPKDYEGRVTAISAESAELDREYAPLLAANDGEKRSASAREFRGPDGGHMDLRVNQNLSPGELFINSEEFRAWAKNNAGHDSLISGSPTIHIGGGLLGVGPEMRAAQAEYRDSVGSDSNTATAFLPVAPPVAPVTYERRLFIRDLMNVIPTRFSAVRATRETSGPANDDSGVANVAAGTLKPLGVLTALTETLPVEVIAAALDINTQMLDDADALAAWINQKLLYRLKKREEAQILAGNGTSPNLKGIRTYSDVQDQAFATDALTSLALSFAKIEGHDGVTSAVVMNPADAWGMFAHRASSSGVLDWQNPWASPVATVLGVPIVRTTAMEAGVALVGDFNSANLWDRREADVRIFEQHADYALRNKVLILAEERVAVTVDRGDHFCEVAVVSGS